MKLLTLNTHSWLEENQITKLHSLAKFIAKENFDIIALQEVNQQTSANIATKITNYINPNQEIIKVDNFALLLVNLLQETYQQTYFWTWFYNHQSYGKYDEGVALLSKHPFKNVMRIPFSKTTDPNDYHTRVACGAKIEIAKQEFYFYSIHASWWTSPEGKLTFPDEVTKLNQFSTLATPTFLLGDFNNPSQVRHEGYDLITQSWFDTYKLAKITNGSYTMGGNIAGWEQNTKPLRLDFIFTNQQLQIKSAQVNFDGRNEAPISDHYAYSIEF